MLLLGFYGSVKGVTISSAIFSTLLAILFFGLIQIVFLGSLNSYLDFLLFFTDDIASSKSALSIISNSD